MKKLLIIIFSALFLFIGGCEKKESRKKQLCKYCEKVCKCKYVKKTRKAKRVEDLSPGLAIFLPKCPGGLGYKKVIKKWKKESISDFNKRVLRFVKKVIKTKTFVMRDFGVENELEMRIFYCVLEDKKENKKGKPKK
jgi:hypothetical protein